MPETMHGTEPGLMGSGDTVTLLGIKVWGGSQMEILTQKDMDMDSMHNNL